MNIGMGVSFDFFICYGLFSLKSSEWKKINPENENFLEKDKSPCFHSEMVHFIFICTKTRYTPDIIRAGR